MIVLITIDGNITTIASLDQFSNLNGGSWTKAIITVRYVEL